MSCKMISIGSSDMPFHYIVPSPSTALCSPLGERLINPLFPAAFRTLNASNRLRNCCSAGKANRKSLFWSCYTLWGNSKMACFDKLEKAENPKFQFQNLKPRTYSQRTNPFSVLVVLRYSETNELY